MPPASCARFMNSLTASDSTIAHASASSAGHVSGVSSMTTSPSTARRSRDVTRTVSEGAASQKRSMVFAAKMICSKLSSTRSARPASASASAAWASTRPPTTCSPSMGSRRSESTANCSSSSVVTDDQIAEPGASVVGREVGEAREREPCLSDARRASERDEARGSELGGHALEERVASNQRGEGSPAPRAQRARLRDERLLRGKRGHEPPNSRRAGSFQPLITCTRPSRGRLL